MKRKYRYFDKMFIIAPEVGEIIIYGRASVLNLFPFKWRHSKPTIFLRAGTHVQIETEMLSSGQNFPH